MNSGLGFVWVPLIIAAASAASAVVQAHYRRVDAEEMQQKQQQFALSLEDLKRETAANLLSIDGKPNVPALIVLAGISGGLLYMASQVRK